MARSQLGLTLPGCSYGSIPCGGSLPKNPQIGYTFQVHESGVKKPVERMFPFVLRARILIPGRELLARSKRKLHFVLVTDDLSENSRKEILSEFTHYPVVQHFTSEDLERFFRIKGAKVIGFAKSSLAQSIYAELKEHRLNRPASPAKTPPEAPPPVAPSPK